MSGHDRPPADCKVYPDSHDCHASRAMSAVQRPHEFAQPRGIKYGNATGTPRNGMLHEFIHRGPMLTATDYFSGVSEPATMPSVADCIAVQFYTSMAPVCSGTNVQLERNAQTPTSPATHTSTTFQLADAGGGKYEGSRMDTSLDAAFTGARAHGCSAEVVNR